jgi:hypothetical protein
LTTGDGGTATEGDLVVAPDERKAELIVGDLAWESARRVERVLLPIDRCVARAVGLPVDDLPARSGCSAGGRGGGTAATLSIVGAVGLGRATTGREDEDRNDG